MNWDWSKDGMWLFDGQDMVLYYTTDDNGLHGEPEAKALIAAAPDMFAALDDCPNMDDFDTVFEFRVVFNHWWDKQALPAIEKAKGERS